MPWRPLRHYILKVASRCDLACDHCYVYEHADTSWRGRPPIMAAATVRAAAARIAEHAGRHRLARVSVILHGGEPLLLGPARLRAVLDELRTTIGPVCELDLRMQTNGVRLDERTAAILLAAKVHVGVSLDGDRDANDRHRRFRTGATSLPQTRRALALLREPRFRPIYAGVLCTVDVANDPVAVYDALLAEDPPRLDLLLPHATWEHPPPPGTGAWLRAVYDRWVAGGRPVPIRLFDSIRSLALGGPGGTEWVGVDAGDLVVIETDGDWEEPDSMKTTVDGAAATGLTVFDHSADEVTAQPAMRRRQAGLDALSATCRACDLVRQCGGGLTAHRYRPGSGFDNPSVYCDDLKELIIAVNEHPPPSSDLGTLPADVFDQLGYGFGDATAVGTLADAELAINRALLGAVVDLTGGDWHGLPQLERSAPAAFAEVLAHPYLRSWAVSSLDGTRPADAGRIAAIAEAVSLRANSPINRAAIGNPGAPAHLIRVDGAAVLLDDVDPDRDRFGTPPAGTLDDDEVTAWTNELTAAWAILGEDAPDQVGGLRRGLRVITPLEPDPGGTIRSATSRHAFGALGIARPGDSAVLAVLLVHEFQHTKLGAVLDLIDLVPDEATGERIRVGWRPDPRPVEAALQGAYAHLGIADMWRRRAERDPGCRSTYTMYRDWTAAAIIELQHGERLTPAGKRFVGRMAETVAGWA